MCSERKRISSHKYTRCLHSLSRGCGRKGKSASENRRRALFHASDSVLQFTEEFLFHTGIQCAGRVSANKRITIYVTSRVRYCRCVTVDRIKSRVYRMLRRRKKRRRSARHVRVIYCAYGEETQKMNGEFLGRVLVDSMAGPMLRCRTFALIYVLIYSLE